jgi:hypothetical protein
MSEAVEGQRISLPWALMCALASLVVGITLNETLAHGHGKAIAFGVFVTTFIAKTFQKSLFQSSVAAFMACVVAFHVFLVFIMPNDSRYAGGLLFPAGVIDIGIFYYLFGLVTKR